MEVWQDKASGKSYLVGAGARPWYITTPGLLAELNQWYPTRLVSDPLMVWAQNPPS